MKTKQTPEYIERVLGKVWNSPAYVHWAGGTIPPTRIWYDRNDNMLHSSCGVTLPFDYDVDRDLTVVERDLIDALIRYYRETEGILLFVDED